MTRLDCECLNRGSKQDMIGRVLVIVLNLGASVWCLTDKDMLLF